MDGPQEGVLGLMAAKSTGGVVVEKRHIFALLRLEHPSRCRSC